MNSSENISDKLGLSDETIKLKQSTLTEPEEIDFDWNEDVAAAKKMFVKYQPHADGESEYCFVTVQDWQVLLWHFGPDPINGAIRPPVKYIECNEGKLKIESVRLQRELKPFAIEGKSIKLYVQRWGTGYSTQYHVSEAKEGSKNVATIKKTKAN